MMLVGPEVYILNRQKEIYWSSGKSFGLEMGTCDSSVHACIVVDVIAGKLFFLKSTELGGIQTFMERLKHSSKKKPEGLEVTQETLFQKPCKWSSRTAVSSYKEV